MTVPTLWDYGAGVSNDLDTTKVTPHLYAHLKMDEGSGDILTDSSGNGHGMTFNTTGTYATAALAAAGGFPIWNSRGLVWTTATLGNSFIASSSTEYNWGDQTRSSIYVHRFKLTAAVAANQALLSKRGSVVTVGAGYQHDILTTTTLARILTSDGATTVDTLSKAAAITLNETYTMMLCFDASTTSFHIVTASDVTDVQHTIATKVTSALDVSGSTAIAAIGQRDSVLNGTEPASNIERYGSRFYEDLTGGALPSNLEDICRWLHMNPTANIPVKWWP